MFPINNTLCKVLAISLVIPALGLAGCDADDEFDDEVLDAEVDDDPSWRPDRVVVTEVYELDEEDDAGEPQDPHPIPPMGIADDPIGPEQLPTLNQGTSTTDFEPVVRVENSSGGLCTGTAISDDVLVTAAHCLKSGNSVRNWLKVREGHGANNSAEGHHSSYFIMSEDIYDNVNVGSSAYPNYYSRDFAFVKFGPNTFDAWYDLASISAQSDLEDDDVILIGFGGNDTKHYGAEVVTNVSAYNSDYWYANTDNSNGVANVESGDSGGPMLRAVGNSYEIVGVLYGSGGSTSAHAVLTDDVYDHVSPIINSSLSTYCAETWEDPDFANRGFSFCVTSLIDDDFADDSGFSDTFKIERHDRLVKWRDKLSSAEVPDNMLLTLFNGSGQSGYSATYQTGLPMGAASTSRQLGTEGINNSVSSYSVTYTSANMLNRTYQLESKKHEKCLDLHNDSTANGTWIVQQSCDDSDSGQELSFDARGNGYEIVHDASGKCVQSGFLQGPITLETCDGSDSQLFTFEDNDSTDTVTDFQIETHDGWCLSMILGSGNGNWFAPMPCNASSTQGDWVIRYR